MRVEISAVFGVILILSAPIISASESSYSFDDDGWLTQLAGPERLALGDEFGCHLNSESFEEKIFHKRVLTSINHDHAHERTGIQRKNPT